MTWTERLQTERLVLRRPVHGDAAAVFDEYARDREVTRYLTWRPHATLDDTRSFLLRCDDGWDSGTDLTWALSFAGNDHVIGMIGLRPRGHKPDIGYVLSRRYWGQGLMPEAAAALVHMAFRDPSVYRVWALCDVENRASARVMEKVGMTHEGILRRWIVHPNVSPHPRDVHCYALVRNAGGAP